MAYCRSHEQQLPLLNEGSHHLGFCHLGYFMWPTIIHVNDGYLQRAEVAVVHIIRIVQVANVINKIHQIHPTHCNLLPFLCSLFDAPFLLFDYIIAKIVFLKFSKLTGIYREAGLRCDNYCQNFKITCHSFFPFYKKLDWLRPI